MFRNSCLGLGIIFLLFLAGAASAASCKGKTKATPITYEKLWPIVTYNNDKTTKYLDNLDRKTSHNRGKRASRVGVTQRKNHFGYEMQLFRRGYSNGSSCVGIKQIKLRYGFERMKVYVAKKYQKHSCRYKAILKHENTHVKINANILAKFSKHFRKYMKSKISGMGVRRGRNFKKMEKQIEKEISATLKSQSQLFQKMLEKEHAKIDTSESYRRVHASC